MAAPVMAAKLQSRPLGYDNVAFDYRYLDTKLSPLALLDAYYSLIQPFQRPGQWVWNTYGKVGLTNPALFYTGRAYDDTYRILADEYYRELACES